MDNYLNYKERKAFRRTEAWKNFRAKIRRNVSVDAITKEPLTRNWNLHHLDLNHSHYTDLSDMTHFMCLNELTHNTVHFLFHLYHKDRKVMDRIMSTLELMEKLTWGEKNENI